MNQQDNGLFRDHVNFLRDYRQRAGFIGGLQLVGSIFYLGAALLVYELMLIWSSAFNWKNSDITEFENGTTSTVEVDFQTPALESAFSTVYFWMVLNVIRAILHIFSSVFLLWATCEETPRLRAIRLCNFSRIMNLTFLMYEIVVFVVMYQEWGFAFSFILYRFWFHHEVRGLLSTIQSLTPPPPGHVHHD